MLSSFALCASSACISVPSSWSRLAELGLIERLTPRQSPTTEISTCRHLSYRQMFGPVLFQRVSTWPSWLWSSPLAPWPRPLPPLLRCLAWCSGTGWVVCFADFQLTFFLVCSVCPCGHQILLFSCCAAVWWFGVGRSNLCHEKGRSSGPAKKWCVISVRICWLGRAGVKTSCDFCKSIWTLMRQWSAPANQTWK